jgi:hypothetical protein
VKAMESDVVDVDLDLDLSSSDEGGRDTPIRERRGRENWIRKTSF